MGHGGERGRERGGGEYRGERQREMTGAEGWGWGGVGGGWRTTEMRGEMTHLRRFWAVTTSAVFGQKAIDH